jgi:hypothetical protein
MRARNWVLISLFVILGIIYVVFFTEWLNPAPIEIASQVRFSAQPPRFGRPQRKPAPTPQPGQAFRVVRKGSTNGSPETEVVEVTDPGQQPRRIPTAPPAKLILPAGASNMVVNDMRNAQPAKSQKPSPTDQYQRVGSAEIKTLGQDPNGVANVTFSLDGWYQLTHIRVEDVPADGSAPKVMWQCVGKSLPLESLLYKLVPEGMHVIPAGADAEPLLPGVPYRLIVEAGRRRGTNNFATVELSQ